MNLSGREEDKMPIYEYFCPKCSTQFELRRSFSDSDKLAQCAKCNSDAQKLTSSFACKTGGNIQAAEKPFRNSRTKELDSSIPSVLITPPPNQTKLLSTPAKKSIRARPRKK